MKRRLCAMILAMSGRDSEAPSPCSMMPTPGSRLPSCWRRAHRFPRCARPCAFACRST